MGQETPLPLPCAGDKALRRWLADDVPLGDLTTFGLGIGGRPGRMTFRARQAMRLACIEEAARLIELAGADRVEIAVPSGADVAAEALLLTAEGPAASLHAGWKVAQTLVEVASGMATVAAAIVAAVRHHSLDVAVACTRKSVPGAKFISVKAILAGGAVPHRLGLSETILVFANHRAFLGSESVHAALLRLRRRCPEKKIVYEPDSLAEALALVEAEIDVFQLDKVTPPDVAALRGALGEMPRRPLVAAAGGIHAGNAGAYVEAGADIIVTSAPYTAAPLDVRVAMMAIGEGGA